jgi:branched-chain amino acid transport system ATP-binding protein
MTEVNDGTVQEGMPPQGRVTGTHTSNSYVVSVNGLEVSFGDAKILQGVTFGVTRGSTVGIIGPNGSGKTTLFNCLSGFVAPSAGSIYVGEKNVTSFSPNERARCGLGRVFQNFGIFREMTVLENLVIALQSKVPWGASSVSSLLPWGSAYRQVKEEAFSYLQEVKLAEKAQLKAGSLSGGQMRLLEIIRAVAFGATVLLLDEPTAGVSPRMKDTIAELITTLHSNGKTVLIIEHDVNFIQRFCERILVLNEGQVVLDDTPERVRENKALQEIYFGTESVPVRI